MFILILIYLPKSSQIRNCVKIVPLKKGLFLVIFNMNFHTPKLLLNKLHTIETFYRQYFEFTITFFMSGLANNNFSTRIAISS